MGWEVHQNANGKASSRGFADMVLTKDGRLIFAYFKSPHETISKTQHVWVSALKHCAYPVAVHIWRWSDLDDIVRLLGSQQSTKLLSTSFKNAQLLGSVRLDIYLSRDKSRNIMPTNALLKWENL